MTARLRVGLAIMALVSGSNVTASAACDPSLGKIQVRILQLCDAQDWKEGSAGTGGACSPRLPKRALWTLTAVKAVLRSVNDKLPVCLEYDTVAVYNIKWTGSGFSLPVKGDTAANINKTDLGRAMASPELTPRSWRRLDIVLTPDNRGPLADPFGKTRIGALTPGCSGAGAQKIGFTERCLAGNGIMLESSQFTWRVLTHEIGHWLGLLHTWEPPCETNDMIKETVPEHWVEARAADLLGWTCDQRRTGMWKQAADLKAQKKPQVNGCGAPLDAKLATQFSNAMQYTECSEYFVDEQKQVMRAAWKRRQELTP